MAVEKDILFVFGSGRSGMTWVATLLRDWFDYGFTHEGRFIHPWWKRLNSYGNLEKNANLDRLIRDFESVAILETFRERWSVWAGYPVDVRAEHIYRHLPDRTYAGVVYAIFAAMADQINKNRVGNAYPGHYRYLPLLLEMFPNARFIAVFRDGRDVALSLKRLDWGGENAFTWATKWKSFVINTKDFSEEATSSQFLWLKYETLLQEPDKAVSQLEQFLDIKLSPEMRSALISHLHSNPLSGNYNKWKNQMSAREVYIFDAVAGQELDDLGYEVINPKADISNFSIFLYRVEDFILRLVRHPSAFWRYRRYLKNQFHFLRNPNKFIPDSKIK